MIDGVSADRHPGIPQFADHVPSHPHVADCGGRTASSTEQVSQIFEIFFRRFGAEPFVNRKQLSESSFSIRFVKLNW